MVWLVFGWVCWWILVFIGLIEMVWIFISRLCGFGVGLGSLRLSRVLGWLMGRDW